MAVWDVELKFRVSLGPKSHLSLEAGWLPEPPCIIAWVSYTLPLLLLLPFARRQPASSAGSNLEVKHPAIQDH